MQAPLQSLGARLIAHADGSLLDAPLDALGPACDDADAFSVLEAMFEAGDARTLREALSDGLLAQFLEASCTRSEEAAVVGQLRSWLYDRSSGDDPERLVPSTSAPHEPAALRAWAAAHGVTHELSCLARTVLGSDLESDVTIEQACLGHAETPRASLIPREDTRAAARQYIESYARGRAALSARRELWHRKRPAGALGLLAQRLRAFVMTGAAGESVAAEGEALGALHSVRFAPMRPVTLDQTDGVARGACRAATEPEPRLAALYLSGFEQRGLTAHCAHCTDDTCPHTRALAGRLYDACLDPGDRLHASLSALVAVPSWQRFVGALRGPGEGRAADSQGVTFRLRSVEGGLSVGALAPRGPTRTGQKSKLTAAARILRSGHHLEHDVAALEAVAALQRTLAPSYVLADLRVLRALVEHPRVELEPLANPVQLEEHSLAVSFREQPEGLLPQVSLAGEKVDAAPGERALYLLGSLRSSGALPFAPLTPALRRLLTALTTFRGVLPKESFSALATWLHSIKGVAQVQMPHALLGAERPPPDKLLLQITPGYDEGIDATLCSQPLPLGPLWPPGAGSELAYGFSGGKQIHTRRRLEEEKAMAAQVCEALDFASHLRLGEFSVRIEDRQAALELLSQAARMSDILSIEWAERARALRIVASANTQSLHVGLFKKGEFLAVEGGVRVLERELAVSKLLAAALRGERFVPIEGEGYLEIERELFSRLTEAASVLMPKGPLRAPAAAAPLLLAKLGEHAEAHDDLTQDFLARMDAPATPAPLPASFQHVLRPYQAEGVSWILQRSAWAKGVCLADEMGLGKTVQALAVLAHRGVMGPALVVAPTSLGQNWLDEAARFAPELDVRAYRGEKRRQHLDELGPNSVLVTSYEVLTRDLDALLDIHFATQVVDEAQMVKNAPTQRARAVRAIRAELRIALSGTPIENRLGDAWSLFHLLVPDLLGSWSRFRARFAVPIERYENRERAETLRALIAPFLLRRTKQQVEAQLPTRTEVVHMVELSEAEQNLYDQTARRAQKALGRRKRQDEDSAVQLLAELTRLRQLACHPRLVLKDPRAESSKLHALLALLDDILPRGHRALIFSQFTEHLALVREALEQRGLSHLYFDGSTPPRQRAELVSRFQSGQSALFLISLKAGGTGLNLTGADYVIHLDPWWNPAAEDQASDRAHRLGQTRPVTIVKLVTQRTIEERVLGLHEHKRRLAGDVLGGIQAGANSLRLDELGRLLQDPG